MAFTKLTLYVLFFAIFLAVNFNSYGDLLTKKDASLVFLIRLFELLQTFGVGKLPDLAIMLREGRDTTDENAQREWDRLDEYRRAGGSMRKAVMSYYANLHPEIYEYKLSQSKTSHVQIPVSDGKSIPAMIVEPLNGTGSRPVLVWYHGGGAALGSHIELQPYIYGALIPGTVVVSIGYRLAPEHPYPIPTDDCYEGLVWIQDNAENLRVDPNKIAVGGCSAGGLMAAATTIRARNENFQPTLKASYLLVPWLNLPVGSTNSWLDFFDIPGLSAKKMEWFSMAYLRDPKACALDEICNPSALADAKGIPPTILVPASADVIRDDALLYHDLLVKGNVDSTLYALPNSHMGGSLFLEQERLESIQKLATYLH